jgi:hypothetical protein
MVIRMAVAKSFEGDFLFHVRFVIEEENVVFAMRSVVVYDHTAANVARLQASLSFNVDGWRLGWMSLSGFLGYERS